MSSGVLHTASKQTETWIQTFESIFQSFTSLSFILPSPPCRFLPFSLPDKYMTSQTSDGNLNWFSPLEIKAERVRLGVGVIWRVRWPDPLCSWPHWYAWLALSCLPRLPTYLPACLTCLARLPTSLPSSLLILCCRHFASCRVYHTGSPPPPLLLLPASSSASASSSSSWCVSGWWLNTWRHYAGQGQRFSCMWWCKTVNSRSYNWWL